MLPPGFKVARRIVTPFGIERIIRHSVSARQDIPTLMRLMDLRYVHVDDAYRTSTYLTFEFDDMEDRRMIYSSWCNEEDTRLLLSLPSVQEAAISYEELIQMASLCKIE